MHDLTRRDVTGALLLGAGLAASLPARAAGSWNSGEVLHILPAASATDFLIKASFARPFENVTLNIDGTRIRGEPTDSEGYYWRFHAAGLEPGRTFMLQLRRGRKALCDPWPLATFPGPEADPESFRLLAFTCAGGLEGAKSLNNAEAFRPLDIRRRLLRRALSFKPQAAVAIGDHIYWDQKAWLEHPHAEIRRLTREVYDRFGYFDRAAAIFGTANETLIKRLAAPQISALYGCMMRSTPCFFVNDDHDYFENDDATPSFVAFPPDEFQVRAARAVQRLFYPEFLPDGASPPFLPGSSALDNGPGVGESFGSIRVGALFEALIYDCGRFLTLKGPSAGLVPPETEDWLITRTKNAPVRHLIHMPSHPMGWTAGKWREWYPDVVAPKSGGKGDVIVSTHREGQGGHLTTSRAKYMWQQGWFSQHQRIVSALSAQTSRPAVMVSGDLHAVGAGVIRQSGDLDLGGNPVHSILAGPIGTSTAGWPTFARGTRPEPSVLIKFSQEGPPFEKNGFTLIDVTAASITVRQFAWREPDPGEAIDSLEPFSTFSIPKA
ncbi:MAG: hypothetical protein HXY23_03975 [Parvularculaceae bacterium]|nr:hypothetical protein [Parvularculaceae bacterium]